MKQLLYLSFDEVPSFKGASTHILGGLRVPCREFEVTLVTLGELQLPDSAGFRHRPLAIRERNYLRRALLFRRRIEELLARGKWDLLHFRGPFEGLPAVRTGIPCIYELNAVPSVELPYHFGALPPHILELLRGWEDECLRRAAAVICPSERIRHFITERVPELAPTTITVLRNGYDPGSANLESGRARFVPRPDEPLRGVYLGTLAPWQGVQWSLRAIRELRPKVSLDIIAPHQKVQWRRMARRISRYGLDAQVRLLPALARWELSAALSGYDFGFAPLLKTERNATQGCCPLKILDYLAHGLPVVAADLFVVRELIRDEHYPWYFQPGSGPSLRETLMRLSDSLQRGERCDTQRLLADHPTWQEYGEQLLAIYRSLLDTAGRAATSP